MTDTERIVTQAAEAAHDRRSHRGLIIAVALAAVGVLGLFGLLLAQRVQVAQVRQQQAEAAVVAQRLADQVRALGARPVVQPPTPVAPAVPEAPPSTRVVGPTQADLDAAVERYFATHPPGDTPAIVATKVAAYLTAHPPKPGPPPTPAMIATAASHYIQAHAADFRGQPGINGTNGVDGKPGQDATDAQVQAAVSSYCDAHNQCQGPQGLQGVSVSDVEFDRDDSGTCMVVVTLHNPATGNNSTITHPAGDAACEPAIPTTTTEPPDTTSGGLLNLGGN